MSETEMYDLIIIGGGPGGLTAGIYAMRAALKTLLIEMGPPGGQVNNSDSVENWPGEEHIGGAELAMKFSLHAQSYAVCDGFFFRDKTVVVVGGGDAAVEESLYLAKLAKQLYIVHRRDELRAGAILQQRKV